jgi:uncharacterized delta-60 repeat protein
MRRGRRFLVVIALVSCALGLHASAWGAQDDPATFESSAFTDLAVLPGGKVLAAGYVRDCRTEYWYQCDPGVSFVNRYRANGKLDRSYGSGGSAVLPGDLLGPYGIGSIALQSGGALILSARSESQSRLYRFTPAGTLDTGFGAGGMVETSDPDFLADASPGGLVVTAADDLLVSEFSRSTGDNAYAVARFDDDGNADAGFGDGGRVVEDLGSVSAASRTDGLIQADDGSITVVGSSYTDVRGSHTLAVRFSASGAPDPGFGGGDGIADLATGIDRVDDVVAVEDGVLLAGADFAPYYVEHGCGCYERVTQISSDGEVATDFDRSGIQGALGGSLFARPDGAVFYAGTESTPYGGSGPARIRVSSFGPSGDVAPRFSEDGTRGLRIAGQGSDGRAVASDGNGGAFVGGSVTSPHCLPPDSGPRGVQCDAAALIHLDRRGALATRFGAGGVVTSPAINICAAFPTEPCGLDLDRDEFIDALSGAVRPTGRIVGRRLRLSTTCPAVVDATCEFRLNASARKSDKLGAHARSYDVPAGRTKTVGVLLHRATARRIARLHSAIVWSVARSAVRPEAARSITKVRLRE